MGEIEEWIKLKEDAQKSKLEVMHLEMKARGWVRWVAGKLKRLFQFAEDHARAAIKERIHDDN